MGYKQKINPVLHKKQKEQVSIDPFDRVVCFACDRVRFKKFMILETGNWLCPEREICNAIWKHKLKVKTNLEQQNKKNIICVKNNNVRKNRLYN